MTQEKFQEITYSQAHQLVSKFHYLGKTRFIGQHCFGFFKNEELVGAVVYSPLSVPESAMSAFGYPRGNYPFFVEMSRMVLHPELNGTNAGSQLIGYSLRCLRKKNIKAVITYADSSRHVGSVYQAANFTYHGLTAQKSDFVSTDGKKISRGSAKNIQGKWVPRTRKHRYVFLFDKKLNCIWPKEKYPKQNLGAHQ